MDQAISRCDDLTPRDFRRVLAKRLRYMRCRLTDQFEIAKRRIIRTAILDEARLIVLPNIREGFSAKRIMSSR